MNSIKNFITDDRTKNITLKLFTVLINVLMALAVSAVIYDWQLSRRAIMIVLGLSVPFFIINRKSIVVTKFELVLLSSTAFYIISGLISYIINSPYELGLDMVLENHIFLLAIIPVSTMIKHLKLNKTLLYIALIALVISSSIEAMRMLISGIERPAVFSTGNSNIFAVMFTAATLMILFISMKRKRAILGWITVFFGVVTLYFNESRASWLIFLVVAATLLFISLKSRLKRAIVILSGVVLIIGAMQFDIFQDRIKAGINDVKLYMEGERDTSLGIRADLAQIAIYYFKKSPVFGIGPRRLGDRDFTSKHEKSEDFTYPILLQSHFHNQVLEDLTTKGIVGFISLISLLGSFLLYFYKNRTVNIYSTLGGIVLFTFIVSGLTEVTFMQYMITMQYVVVMPVIIALIEQNSSRSTPLGETICNS